MAALEFGSLYAHLERARNASAAEKKTEAMVRQALEQGWAFRVIQERCRREKERLSAKPDRATPDSEPGGDGEDGGDDSPRTGRAPPTLFRDDDKQLVVYLPRIGAATSAQRAELRAALEALLRSLAD
jgi:hypothetical protein